MSVMNGTGKPTLPGLSRFYTDAPDLKGQTALITGATAGMGEQIAYRYAELGVKLVLVGKREERLKKLQAELSSVYAEAVGLSGDAGVAVGEGEDSIRFYAVDVTDKGKVEEMAREVGFVDILVNNAGCAIGIDAADECPYEDMLQMINTNLVAAAHLTQLFGKAMREKERGHVVFISSVAARDFYEGGST